LRPSIFLSIYSGVMSLIVLFSRLSVIFGNIFNGNLHGVHTFEAMMKISTYAISHSCFLFYTLLFLGEVVSFLHVLLCFNSSIYYTFTCFDSNLNNMKAQISVLVT
jgi:hypothetical protein